MKKEQEIMELKAKVADVLAVMPQSNMTSSPSPPAPTLTSSVSSPPASSTASSVSSALFGGPGISLDLPQATDLTAAFPPGTKISSLGHFGSDFGSGSGNNDTGIDVDLNVTPVSSSNSLFSFAGLTKATNGKAD